MKYVKKILFINIIQFYNKTKIHWVNPQMVDFLINIPNFCYDKTKNLKK